MHPFVWTSKTDDAAQLVAEGDLSMNAIAQAVETSPPTLRKWREHPDFVARVESLREEYRSSIRARGIAVRERRVEAYNQRWRKLQAIIEARANDPTLAEIPGGDTGLIVLSDWKQIGHGEDADCLPIYELDTGLLKETRELEKQAAQDLGQWTEKKELSGPNGSQLPALIEASIVKIYGTTTPKEPDPCSEQ